MARNYDPKPGRWILPLVIVGMVGFTYFFVRSIEPPPPADVQPQDPPPVTTTVPEEPDTTVTTTLPELTQQYLDDLAADDALLDALVTTVTETNAAWESAKDFGASKTAFQAFVDDAAVFADSVELPGPPAGDEALATAHGELATRASAIADGAQAILDGLLAPDTGQQRTAALEDFTTAVAAFKTQLAVIQTLATTGTGA